MRCRQHTTYSPQSGPSRDYIPLLGKNDVVAISAPRATAAMVENYLGRPGVADLFEIE